VHIAPELGARFSQYTATLGPDATSASPGRGVERFLFVLEGQIDLAVAGAKHILNPGGFAFIPADVDHQIVAKNSSGGAGSSAARLVVFEKPYQASDLAAVPKPVIGDERDQPAQVYFDDEWLRLQTLLPIDPAFDMAVNIFTYQPGAGLPQVEIHVMEHGLIFLDGGGIYRLGDDYHPVQAGDVIWMASYCPQWFGAIGKTPARYLYYKDIHRDRLSDRPAASR
jgi:(S)-ureidoglycine aminohydrolase